MSNLGITINGREYKIACDDGQDAHLKRIAADLDNRVRTLAKAMGPTTPDSLLLVIASIMLTDELQDAKDETEKLKTSAELGFKATNAHYQEELDSTLADTINAIADRIERIAGQLH